MGRGVQSGGGGALNDLRLARYCWAVVGQDVSSCCVRKVGAARGSWH